MTAALSAAAVKSMHLTWLHSHACSAVAWRPACGNSSIAARFLGLLHMEIWSQRLEQEHNASVITTSPTVPYVLEHPDGARAEIQNPSQVARRGASPPSKN